jgi:antitoxin HigA-1
MLIITEKEVDMLMHYPAHPHLLMKRILIDEANLAITDAAKVFGVSRVSLSKIINKKSNISPEMAIRLSLALNISSEMCVNMQLMYDLWQAEKKKPGSKIKRF